MDAHAIPHEFIFIDEAGFNLAKTRRKGRNANLGPYNTAHILTFLDRLHNILIPPERMNDADHQRNRYVVVWDNVSFHHAAPVNISRAIPPTILTISEPHRRVLFGMAVEGIRPAALCAHASCAGHGRGM